MLSIVIFVLVLSFLIVVHEMGHFIVAKAVGVRVERFALGFGPVLYSKTIAGTEFMICAIPLGGYVKPAGEDRLHSEGKADEFCSKPPGHRALIAVMGPVVNYVLAYLCLCIVFMIGYPTLSNTVGEVMDGYPAQQSGLLSGDKIVRIDSQDIKSWDDVKNYISQSTAAELNLVIVRDGNEVQKTLFPRNDVLENIFGQKENVRVIGIQPKEEITVFKYGFGEAVVRSGQKLWEITSLTYKALYRIATGAMAAKDAVTGPVGIFFIIKEAAEMGISYLLYIVGIISASLAIFNLLPFPVLDGGHLVLLAIEKIRGRALPENIEENIIRFGVSMLICLAIFVFYSDFARLGWIDKVINLGK